MEEYYMYMEQAYTYGEYFSFEKYGILHYVPHMLLLALVRNTVILLLIFYICKLSIWKSYYKTIWKSVIINPLSSFVGLGMYYSNGGLFQYVFPYGPLHPWIVFHYLLRSLILIACSVFINYMLHAHWALNPLDLYAKQKRGAALAIALFTAPWILIACNC